MIRQTQWDRWFDVFATGQHKPNGRTFTAADLDQLAQNFNPARLAVPLVLGHTDPSIPPFTAPAFGWVGAVRRVGNKLQVFVKEAESTFTEVVKAGLWPRRSIRIANRPGGGGLELHHVGFLGATAPAVPGLAPIDFATDPGETFEFHQEDHPVKTIEQLEADLAATQAQLAAEKKRTQDFAAAAAQSQIATAKAEAKAAVDKLVADKKLPPALAEGMPDFLFSLSGETQDFAASDGTVLKASPREFMDKFLGGLGDGFKGLFGTAVDSKNAPGAASDFALPGDFKGALAGGDLHAQATAYAAQHKVSYERALETVMRGAK
ncbi:MAG: hypothetical protein IV100_12555 [Myxococcales bacterium]|uniref:hypothetical protein n=1 Tax=Sediminibacterium sp. TaxID=1917865 RepID=UPI001D46BFD5|nr:hypothetical protein [Sediminibacterium sp.]MBT9485831.1 hypothetical protein [Sediminibacterium sp.]MBT9556857.1 hypothetical protein [Myxococcales bacterium]